MVFKFKRTSYPSGYAFGYDPTGRCHKRKGAGRKNAVEGGQGYQLREAAADYKLLFGDENGGIGIQNAYLWNLKAE